MSSAAQKLQAAQKLLMEPTTTREKISAACALLHGIHSRLDGVVAECQKHLSHIDKIEQGDIVGLSAEHLPEHSEEEKKRKRALLLLLNTWRQLKSEVERVQAEFENMQTQGSGSVSTFGKIFGFAKGPLGILTILAVGIVVAMNATAVEITISNQGCGTMLGGGSIPSIPGLKLPTEIPNNGTAIAVIPGVPVTVDGTQSGSLQLSLLNYGMSFQLPSSIKDVTLNGESLLNKKTEVRLSERDEHMLELQCL